MDPTVKIGNEMMKPTKFERIAVDIGKDKKKALINYTASCGTNITLVIRSLVDRLLRGEIDLNFKPPVRVTRAKK